MTTSGSPLAEPSPDGRRRRGALAILAAIFFLWGFVTVLNDVLVPHLKAVFELNYTQSLLVQFVFFSSYFLLALPAARLIEWVGYRRAIATGLAATGCGALLFLPAATHLSYPLFLGALFVLACGITTLQVAANPYVTVIGPRETASSRLNLVQAFNSLGTAVAPAFGSLLILAQSASGTALGEGALSQAQRLADAQTVRLPYAGIALVLFALALVIALWPLPQPAPQNQPRSHSGDSLWRHRRLLLGIGAIFLYVGAENCVGSFLINYLSLPSVGAMSHAEAAFYVSLFWGGAMFGRLLGAALMRRLQPALLLAAAAVGAALLIMVSINVRGYFALWTIVLVGLMNSIMFPTIFSLAISDLGHLTQRGSGLLIMAIVGGALLPMAQALLADRHGLRGALLVPVLCYLYILYFGGYCYEKSTETAPLS